MVSHQVESAAFAPEMAFRDRPQRKPSAAF
jgi:hypothetical protein